MICDHPECTGRHGRAPMATCCPAYQKSRRAYARRIKKANPPVQDPEYFRAYRLRTEYGMTVDQYEQMLLDQNGVCAICDSPPNGKRLNVDHCHNTQQIRGLLCFKCNSAIGLLDDHAAKLDRAVKYLSAER